MKLYQYLIIYALLIVVLFSAFNLNINNSLQRTNAAISLKEIIQSGDYSVSHFKEYHAHYNSMSGAVDWPPLQMILLTLSFFILPVNIGVLIVNLTITILALIYLYLFVKKYADHAKAMWAVAITSLYPFFLFTAGASFLEIGVVFFTLAGVYHFLEWLEKYEFKQLIATVFFCVTGIYWKTQMVLLLPVLAFMSLKSLKHWKQYATAALLGALLLLPLVGTFYYLDKTGLARGEERTFGELKNLGGSADLPGKLDWYDLEFTDRLTPEKVDLILHRQENSVWQKSWRILSLLAIPLLFLLIAGLPRKREEMFLLLFIASQLAFFAFYGGLPRYYLTMFVAIVAYLCIRLHNSYWLPSARTSLLTALLLVSLAFTGAYGYSLYQGNHVMVTQHDFKNDVKYALDNSEGNITILTTKMHFMAYELLQQDNDHRANVYLLPDDYFGFKQALNGNYSKPYPEYNLPPVRFIVIHEGLESGLLPGTMNYHYGNLANWTTINGSTPRTTTWITQVN